MRESNRPAEFLCIDGKRGDCNETFRNPVTASAGQLLAQAPDTAGIFLDVAVQKINGLYGQGYAEKHPELIGAVMQTAATSYQTTRLTQAIQEAAVMVADTINVGNEQLRMELDQISKDLQKIAEEVAL